MLNISFDGHLSYEEWGLMCEKMEISFPAPVENKVQVPGMDGRLDLSEINAPLTYDEREVRFIFSIPGDYEDWHQLSGTIANAIHGKSIPIIPDTDCGYYYTGRVFLESTKDSDSLDDVVISGSVNPYKYELSDGKEDWLWDPFSFTDGIVREYKDLIVNNRLELTVPGRRKRVMPVITCSSAMTLTCGKTIVNLPKGTTRVYELQLGDGEHILIFTGNGTVSVSYRGGSL